MSAAEVDLEAIGDLVTGTDLHAETWGRARLVDAGLLDGRGRVGDLAVWWAGTRGDAAAGPARDVVLLVPPGAQTSAAPVTGLPREPVPVRTVPLDPPDDPVAAAAWGVRTADALADAGTELLLVSAPDLVASRVLAAQLLGLDAVEANGWPQDIGIDDATWMDQVTRIRDGLRAVRGLRARPIDLLTALGSPILSATTGLLLQSAARRTPALLDGDGAAAAALVAQRLSAYARDWWQVGHLGRHPAQRRCLESLRLTALTQLGVTVEDGTGSLLGLAVLDLAAGLLAGAGPA